MSDQCTLCWRCSVSYDNAAPKCPLCGAANANVDLDLATREMNIQHQERSLREPSRLVDAAPALLDACRLVDEADESAQGESDYVAKMSRAVRALRDALAARGTPAPALDESAIRKDERERCARAIEDWRVMFQKHDAVTEWDTAAVIVYDSLARAIRDLS